MMAQIKNIEKIIQVLSSEPLYGRPNLKSLIVKVHLLEEILLGLDAIIFIHDLKSNHQVWTNGNYLKILGYREEEILKFGLGKAYFLFHPDDVKIILDGIDFLLSDKGKSFSSVYRVRHKEGHWIWMFYHSSIIQRDETGIPRYVLGLAVDFSPLIHSEKQLADLLAENRRLINQKRLECLTQREKEIITHLTEGLNIKEISNLLDICYLTTETHIKNIRHKLGLNHISALINFAVESGLRS